jgi:hypothetical protein
MGRNQAIECLRIAAAFGVVWFHSGLDGKLIAYSGLVVFLALSAYFVTVAPSTKTKTASDLAIRLLVPWVCWFVVYSAINYFRGLPIFRASNGLISDILVGPAMHLWYLPFTFFTIPTIKFVQRRLRPSLFFFVATVLAFLGLLTNIISYSWKLDVPYPQYLFAIAPVATGIVLGMRDQIKFARMAIFIILALSLLLCLTPWSNLCVPYFIGLGITTLAIEYGDRLVPIIFKIDWLSKCTSGVFLTHPLFLSLAKLITNNPTVAGVVAAYLLSTASTFLILREAPPMIGQILFGRVERGKRGSHSPFANVNSGALNP